MAINRQDYQYIRNTIPGQQNKMSDGNLAVGVKVTNLLPELIEANICNPNYADYYGTTTTGKWHVLTNNSTVPNAEDRTTTNGYLRYQLSLEANTSYVLQVVGAAQPKNITLPTNSIVMSNEIMEFGQYLFFNTGDNSTCSLNIYGLSFGYKILGMKDEKLYQLRTFISPSQAKVYLFKADAAWFVNKEGVITGIGDALLYTFATGTAALDATFDLDEALELFSAKPSISASTDRISVRLPDCDNSTKNWKHYNNWKLLGEDANQIRLVAFRDFLTETTRDYCNKTNDHKEQQTEGALRTIQKTKNGYGDNYCNINLENFPGKKIKIQFEPEPLNITSSDITKIDFIWPSESRSLPLSAIDGCAHTPYAIDLFALLGYNEQYCLEKNLSSSKYKYTSVCFAWCLVKKDSRGTERIVKRISECSAPIIIDRQAIEISYSANNNGQYIITPNPCTIRRTTTLSYYGRHGVIAIQKKSQE